MTASKDLAKEEGLMKLMQVHRYQKEFSSLICGM